MNINSQMLKFCQDYKKWLDYQKFLEEKDKPKDHDAWKCFDRKTSFYLSSAVPFYVAQEIYFELDEEDLKYLHDKYSAKLRDELERNISEVKAAYDGIIGEGEE